MAINDVLKDMYKKNTGKELTEEAHNVEDTLKAINKDITLGGGGGDSNVYIFDIHYSPEYPGFIASKTFRELYQAYKDGKIVVGTDGDTFVLYLTSFVPYGLYTLTAVSGSVIYKAAGNADDTPIFKEKVAMDVVKHVLINWHNDSNAYTGSFTLGEAYDFITGGGLMFANIVDNGGAYNTYIAYSAYTLNEGGETMYGITFASIVGGETISSTGAYDDTFDTSR